MVNKKKKASRMKKGFGVLMGNLSSGYKKVANSKWVRAEKSGQHSFGDFDFGIGDSSYQYGTNLGGGSSGGYGVNTTMGDIGLGGGSSSPRRKRSQKKAVRHHRRSSYRQPQVIILRQ